MKIRFVGRYIVPVAVGATTLLGWSPASHPVRAELPVHRQCMYAVEGNCQPMWATWGYYPTQWRPWPTGIQGPITPPATYGTSPHQRPGGIPVDVPTPDEEGEILPDLPFDSLPAVAPPIAPPIEPAPGGSGPAEQPPSDVPERDPQDRNPFLDDLELDLSPTDGADGRTTPIGSTIGTAVADGREPSATAPAVAWRPNPFRRPGGAPAIVRTAVIQDDAPTGALPVNPLRGMRPVQAALASNSLSQKPRLSPDSLELAPVPSDESEHPLPPIASDTVAPAAASSPAAVVNPVPVTPIPVNPVPVPVAAPRNPLRR